MTDHMAAPGHVQEANPWPTFFPMHYETFRANVEKVQALKKERHGNRFASPTEVKRLAPIPPQVYRRVMQSQHANAHVWDDGGDAWKWWTQIINGSRRCKYDHSRWGMVVDY